MLEGGYGRHIRKHNKPKPKQSTAKRKQVPPQKTSPQAPRATAGGCSPKCGAECTSTKRRRSRSLPNLSQQQAVRFSVRGIVGRRLPFTPSPKKKGRRSHRWGDVDGTKGADEAGSSAADIVPARGERTQQIPATEEASADPPQLPAASEETAALLLDRSYLSSCCLAHVQALIGRSL